MSLQASLPPPWWNKVIEQFETIATECTHEGWNSYNAAPVRRETIEEAKKYLEKISSFPDLPMPAIVPLNDGGIQFEWHRGGIDVEIEFRHKDEQNLFVSYNNGLSFDLFFVSVDSSILYEVLSSLSGEK